MDTESRPARLVADWLAPCLVVAFAMALGLFLFASKDPWWPTLAGPAPGVVAAPADTSIGHR